ncbi:MAG: MBOAT family protein, partial [Bacillota bacterium]|nr:MBOAT family protein [Bacillota bacterium]
MLFTSYGFVAFILGLFIVYYLVPRKAQWLLLLGASYLFYFLASPQYLIYIATTTVTTFFAAYKIDQITQKLAADLEQQKKELGKDEKKALRATVKRRQRKWLIACLLLNFGILAAVKYSNFTIANINFLMDTLGSDRQLSFLKIALPMGISFYTFQSMSYIIDIYRNKHPAEKNLLRL